MTQNKVGIITFHASHNYGSMLQAYALQHTVKKMGYKCDIINFRTHRQKALYRPTYSKGNVVRRICLMFLYFPYLKALYSKELLFESFLNEGMTLTDLEFNTQEDIERAKLTYDYYISGSDQIWNTCCYDFDWAYFLTFVNRGKRIAYAPSMGPTPHTQMRQTFKASIREVLKEYDYISVREPASASCIYELTGCDCQVNLDPTLLLDTDEWNSLIDDEPLVKEPYLFLYAPFWEKRIYQKARCLSKRLRLKVVVSQAYGLVDREWLYDTSFLPFFATGPKEFLNLCKYATCVIGCSFHLVAFSIILRTPFIAIDGLEDSRMANLLQITGLESQSIGLTTNAIGDNLLNLDFDLANHRLEIRRKESIQWLQNCLQ